MADNDKSSEKEKTGRSAKKEYPEAGFITAASAFATLAGDKFDQMSAAAKDLSDFMRKNESKFTRVQSVQDGYAALAKAEQELTSIIDLDKIDAITKTLQEALTAVRTKEGI